MALKIKHSAEMNGMQPELIPLIIVANEVYGEHGFDCVITSCTDSKHSNTSLHYPGYAIDFRTKALGMTQEAAKLIRNDILERLPGKDYEVIVEGNHLHGEFQPKWRGK